MKLIFIILAVALVLFIGWSVQAAAFFAGMAIAKGFLIIGVLIALFFAVKRLFRKKATRSRW